VVQTLVALQCLRLIIWLYVRCKLITKFWSRVSVAGALDSFFRYRNKQPKGKTNKFKVGCFVSLQCHTSFVTNTKCFGKFCAYRIQVRNEALYPSDT